MDSFFIYSDESSRFEYNPDHPFRPERAQLQPFTLILMGIMMVGVIVAVIMITQGQRKIPIQYAKRIVGRRMYGGASTYIPLRVNTAGVIPIIFASSILILPTTVAQFFPDSMLSLWIQTYFVPGANGVWEVLYALFIIFFTYF